MQKKRKTRRRRDPRDPDGLGFPPEDETCMAPVKELKNGDAELCGERATQYRLFCTMMIAYCDNHAAEIDEMTEEEKGNAM